MLAQWLSPQFVIASNIAILVGMLGTGVIEAEAASSSPVLNATVQPQCSFGSPTAGTMTVADKLYEMATTNPGGAAAVVQATYSGGLPLITVDLPTAWTTTPQNFSATTTFTPGVTDSQNNTWSSAQGSKAVTPKSTQTTDSIYLNMTASIGSGAYTNGDYSITWTVTCQ